MEEKVVLPAWFVSVCCGNSGAVAMVQGYPSGPMVTFFNIFIRYLIDRWIVYQSHLFMIGWYFVLIWHQQTLFIILKTQTLHGKQD